MMQGKFFYFHIQAHPPAPFPTREGGFFINGVIPLRCSGITLCLYWKKPNTKKTLPKRIDTRNSLCGLLTVNSYFADYEDLLFAADPMIIGLFTAGLGKIDEAVFQRQ